MGKLIFDTKVLLNIITIIKYVEIEDGANCLLLALMWCGHAKEPYCHKSTIKKDTWANS
jgi:hypothetical protein